VRRCTAYEGFRGFQRVSEGFRGFQRVSEGFETQASDQEQRLRNANGRLCPLGSQLRTSAVESERFQGQSTVTRRVGWHGHVTCGPLTVRATNDRLDLWSGLGGPSLAHQASDVTIETRLRGYGIRGLRPRYNIHKTVALLWLPSRSSACASGIATLHAVTERRRLAEKIFNLLRSVIRTSGYGHLQQVPSHSIRLRSAGRGNTSHLIPWTQEVSHWGLSLLRGSHSRKVEIKAPYSDLTSFPPIYSSA
jgi:hypothetical protein